MCEISRVQRVLKAAAWLEVSKQAEDALPRGSFPLLDRVEQRVLSEKTSNGLRMPRCAVGSHAGRLARVNHSRTGRQSQYHYYIILTESIQPRAAEVGAAEKTEAACLPLSQAATSPACSCLVYKSIGPMLPPSRSNPEFFSCPIS